jgi:hypothetical protein
MVGVDGETDMSEQSADLEVVIGKEEIVVGDEEIVVGDEEVAGPTNLFCSSSFLARFEFLSKWKQILYILGRNKNRVNISNHSEKKW